MPNGRRESYEAVPRRPEQQGTEGPAHSKNPMFSVHLLPCLKQTLSCLSPLLLPELVHLLPCLSHTLPLSQTYPVLSQPSVTHQTCSSVTLSFSYPTPVSNIPCPCISPLLLPELVHLLPCLSHTLLLSQTYPVPASALCYSQNLFICYPVFLIPCPLIHLTLSPYPPYPVPILSQKK